MPNIIDLGPVTAYAIAKEHGFTGTEAQWEEYIANAANNAASAADAKNAALAAQAVAEQMASDAEAWTRGTRNLEEVGSADPTYHNNAQWYAEAAAASQTAAGASETAAFNAKQDVLALKDDVTQLKADTTQLKTDAVDAKTAAQTAQVATEAQVANAEAWARGYRNGTPVEAGDAAYHKNSKYYSDLASATLGEVQLIGDNVSSLVAQRGNRLYFDEEEKLLYLMSDDVPLGDGIAVSVGGGGGGGGGGTEYEYTVTLTNLMDSRNISVAGGSTVSLQFAYSSVDADENDDGNGVGTIFIDNARKGSFNAIQGNNTLNITNYLSNGMNIVKIRVDNSEGRYKTLTYTVNVIALTLTTTFPEMSIQNAAVAFPYTPIGTGSKTIHFVMDGTEIDSTIVTTTNRSQTFTIPVQSHGAHVFECYADITVDDALVVSNIIRRGMVFVDSQSTTPIILTTFKNGTCEQGENLRIPYIVYNPLSETADVTLSVISGGTTYSTKNLTGIDRSEQGWIISDYPTGTVIFRITTGSVSKDITMTVTESTVIINPVTDALVMLFDPAGRSNGEATPNSWTYGTITASFSGFGWNLADGWLHDEDGASILRFLPGDQMTIPLKPFETDVRETGYTIEVEMATRDVRDYESVVLSCLNGGRGVQIKSQQARLASEGASISMLFKEDSKIRVTFAIENRNQNRFIYIYINGVMCGVTQYPTDDTFRQASPVGFTIGAESCAIDLYKIRCYSKGLTRSEQLENFVADRPTVSQRRSAAERNDILNDRDEVTISKLPINLSYILLKCPQLPQYKGDKKSGVEVEFVDRSDPSRSWTAAGVELDVQGTSSQYYPIKNYKIKLKSGITYTSSGTTANGFTIGRNQLPTKTICYKADYASSENANNVVLAKFYNDIVPYQTPPQQADSRIRQGIDGFGTTLFWENTATGDIEFLGKGNCNIDKGNENIFGFTEDYPNAQSWEFKNNTSERCLFQSADFTSTTVDEDGNTIMAWENDFEARYPDGSTDIDDFADLAAWVVSTDRGAVSSAADKAARLEKFADEFEDHFVKSAMLFYYIFTETFLMVDSRAKNMFMTTYDGTHWFSLPYDFDTAIGINNEGALTFDYNLEDTDYVNSANVFNGQDSVLWNNFRDAFGPEIRAMYQTLRSQNDPTDPSSEAPFSYYNVIKLFTDHQSVWPEALWNEDAFVKYLEPYLINGERNLGMLQGNKASQRDWWLYNGFRYRDSKYRSGDCLKNYIELRGYATGNITLTPYAHIYGRIQYAAGDDVVHRLTRNVAQVFQCPLSTLNDTEIHIYSADQLSSVGDLSALKVGRANFAAAKKLQSIKVGDEDSNYENPNLGAGSNEFSVGANELLTYVNVANCTSFGAGDVQKDLDLSGCTGIQTVIASGTQLAQVKLPNGGHLQTLKLPSTIKNFTILNQQDLTTLTFDGYGSLTTLRVENTPNVPIYTLISSNSNLDRVRLINVEWSESSSSNLATTITKLKNCYGIAVDGTDLAKPAVVTGRVNVPSITGELLLEINTYFPELVVVANNVPQYLVTYYDYDDTVLYRAAVAEGGNAINPVTAGYISAPTRADTSTEKYTFADFGTLPTNIHSHVYLRAVYTTSYLVTFMNGETTYDTQWVLSGSNASVPSGTPTREATPANTFTFAGWTRDPNAQTPDATALNNITAATTIYAAYTVTGRTYSVVFYNGTTALQSFASIPYGGTATYTGTTPVHPSDPENYEFIGFNPTGQNITGDTNCYATWRYTGINSRKIISRTISGTYTNSTVTIVGDDALCYCTKLDSVVFSKAVTVGAEAFYGCTILKTADFPEAIIFRNAAFGGCRNLYSISAPKLRRLQNSVFLSCTGLSFVSFPQLVYIASSAFANAGIKTYIIGIEQSAVCTLATNGIGTGNMSINIYVPDSLVESYKTATNWSTFSSRIKGISEYSV